MDLPPYSFTHGRTHRIYGVTEDIKPIEQFTADVGAIAAGDLNHTIQPVQGYEPSNLAEKTESWSNG